VSYCNPDGTCAASSLSSLLQPERADAAGIAGVAGVDSSPTFAVSVANGPTATQVRPVRLSRGDGARYTLRIDGANLQDAAVVTLAGVEPYIVVGVPAISADGRRLTVEVLITQNTPLGVVPVVVSGAGWSSPDVPGMRVEIVP